jgi:5-methylcytosine-specific restriction endonuclease McrA
VTITLDSELLDISVNRLLTKLLSISVRDTSQTRDALFDRQKGLCAICGQPMERIGAHRDHVITVKEIKDGLLERESISGEKFARIHQELNSLENLRLTQGHCNQRRTA